MQEKSAETFLVFVHRYEVLVAFKGWFNSFRPGVRLVFPYLHCTPEDPFLGFIFINTATGATKSYDTGGGDSDVADPCQLFPSVLKDLGPDMEIRPVVIEGQSIDMSWECFR